MEGISKLTGHVQEKEDLWSFYVSRNKSEVKLL